MGMPRIRFAVRWLILSMAVTVAILGLWCRHIRFRNQADYHYSKLPGIIINIASHSESHFRRQLFEGLPELEWQNAKDSWHAAMARKYDRAARKPWLSVALDPPEPR